MYPRFGVKKKNFGQEVSFSQSLVEKFCDIYFGLSKARAEKCKKVDRSKANSVYLTING